MRDRTGFDEFYAATAARLVGQLYAMVGAWVRTVAYRIAVSSWRRGRARRAAHERWGGGAQQAQLGRDTLALVEALRLLPPDQRRAVVLFYLAGLPVKTIAEETGSTVSAVKTRLFRARQALAPNLREVDHNGR